MLKKRGKKAQITLFVLIAVVLIISAVFLIYLRSAKIEKFEQEPELKFIEKVPLEINPIKNFIESCIKEKTEESLKFLEEHGGYIYLDRFEADSINPTEGDALEYYKNSNFIIPYWYFMESDNDCQNNCNFNSQIPPLCKSNRNCLTNGDNSIEKELETYLDNELKPCFNNFESFKKQKFEIKELENLKNQVMIREKDVLVNLDYPLEIKKGDKTSKINRFQSTIRSDLSEMYEIAYDILNYEINRCFIGKHTKNYYSYFFGIEDNDLPPKYKTTIGTSRIQTWSLQNVKENLKQKTFQAMQLIGIYNTSRFRWPTIDRNDPDYNTVQGTYDQFVFYPLKRYHDVTVSMFFMPWWEPYLDIKPNEGGILKPTDLGGGGGIAALLGNVIRTRIYEFFYQYSFPVVIEIRKKDSIGKEHVFRFALEENIRANKCFLPNATLVHSASIGQTLLCDEDMLVKNATITVLDENNLPLEDVTVSFYAGDSCSLGATDENGIINAKYPGAYGGIFKFSKEGYIDKHVRESDLTDKVILKKYKFFNVSVKKYNINVTTSIQPLTGKKINDYTLNINPHSLTNSEQVVLNVDRVIDNNNPFDQELNQVVLFNPTDPELNETQFIKLIPGIYEVTITYVDLNGFTIPANCKRYCSKYEDGIFGGDCEDYSTTPNQPQVVETSISGGANLNERTGYWNVTQQDLEIGNKIQFKLIRAPNPTCIDEATAKYESCLISQCVGLEQLNKIEDYSEQYRSYIEPIFYS